MTGTRIPRTRIYCLGCRGWTDSEVVEEYTMANGKPAVKGRCREGHKTHKIGRSV